MSNLNIIETVQNVRTKSNDSTYPTQIFSYNISRNDNGRLNSNMINEVLNQLNEDAYVDNPGIEISYQVAVREPVFATTRKIPASEGTIDFLNYIMHYYDEFDAIEENGTYKDVIIRVYITDKTGQGDNKTTHCFYEALKKLHVFNTTPYKTYEIFMEKYPQLPKDGSVSINIIPFIEERLCTCISVSGDDKYNSRFTDRYNQHCYLKFENNHFDIDKKISKRQGMKNIVKFEDERKLIIVNEDENYAYTFDGNEFKKYPIEYKNGKKVKLNMKGYISEQLRYIKKLYNIKKENLKDEMKEAYSILKKEYDELKEITKGEFNPYKFPTQSSMIKYYAYKYAGRTHINDITEQIELYEFNRLEAATKGGFVDILSNTTKYKEGHSYDIVSAYPSILNSFDFYVQIKKGTMTYLQTKHFNPEKELKYGLYNCKITNPNKQKVYFIFNSLNWYTHFDIKLAMKQELKIELIDSPNNLIYWNIKCSTKANKPAQAMQADKIFNEYVWKLYSLKRDYPNKILKSCLSGLWGRLCEIDKRFRKTSTKGDIIIDDDEIFDEIGYSDNQTTNFTVINKSSPYTSNYARMKPFLLAKQRLDMYERVFEKYKSTHKFIRIMIDGFITDKPIEYFEKCNKKYLHNIVKDRVYHNFHTPNKSIVCPDKNGKLCKECIHIN